MTGPRYTNDELPDLAVKNKTNRDTGVEIQITPPDNANPRAISVDLSGGESISFPVVSELAGRSEVTIEVDGRSTDHIDPVSHSGTLVAFVREDEVELVPFTA